MSLAQSTHLQLVAALAAMSEANLALRAGSFAAPAMCRAARCLEVLADSPDLAPTLRRLCDTLSSQWSVATGPQPLESTPRDVAGAVIIPLRHPR